MAELKVNRALAFEVWTQADQGTPPKAMLLSTKISPRTIARLCRAKRTFENGGTLGTLTEGSRWSLRYLGEVRQWFTDYQATKAQEKERQESANHADNQGASGRPEVVPSAGAQGNFELASTPAFSGPLNLAALRVHAQSMMVSPGFPSLRLEALSWAVTVRLENTGEVPLSFGDIYLHITGDEHGQEVTNLCPHVGNDVYGSRGGIPQADRALDTLIFLTPEKPVLEGVLRFHDPAPFDPSQVVRLALSAKGTGRYRGSVIQWDLGTYPHGTRLGDLETIDL